jgi:hypothetical protein
MEKLTLSLGFGKRLLGRTITAASSTCSLLTGTDPTPSDLLDGSPDYSSSPTVKQHTKGGVVGCTYLIEIQLTLSDGDVLVGVIQIAVSKLV